MSDVPTNDYSRYKGAVKILVKREEWPIVREYIGKMIVGRRMLMTSKAIITEEDKAGHNRSLGFTEALNHICFMEEIIEKEEQTEALQQAKSQKFKDQEKYNKERGIDIS